MIHKNRIPKQVEDFIIKSLACYDPPEVVAAAVKAEYDFLIDPHTIEAYDPTGPAGRTLSTGHLALFEGTRAKFVVSIQNNAVAHKAVRLGMLGGMATAAEKCGDFPRAARLLEQIAKEMGDAYGCADESAMKPRAVTRAWLKEISARYGTGWRTIYLDENGKRDHVFEQRLREEDARLDAIELQDKSAECLAPIEDNPFAYRAVRVRMLSRMATKAEEKGHSATRAKLLEQIAKEMAGAYGSADLAANKPPVFANDFRDDALLDEASQRRRDGRVREVREEDMPPSAVS